MKLYYFTNSFPYGMGEDWKYQELEILKEYFEEIVVVPYTEGGNPNKPRVLSPSIKVLKPLFASEPSYRKRGAILRGILCFRIVCSEFFVKKVFLNKERLGKVLAFVSGAQKILKHRAFKDLVSKSTNETYWFFYWGRGIADVMPFLEPFDKKKIGIRLHRYDIFETESNNYIPFRNALYNKVDVIFSVSEFGRSYLVNKYPWLSKKVTVARLGTKSIGLSSASNDNVFSLVSCSALVPVKRVGLLIDALENITNYKVRWTHIGTGPLIDTLKKKSALLPENIEVIFEGYVNPTRVLGILTTRPFDLFINVSESEGVPVSIMEALSAGIPVLATAAGGTSEIIGDLVGKVVNINITGNELAGVIEEFITMSQEQKKQLRENAFTRYSEMCDMDKNTRIFIERFLNHD